jgi:hypothetical protein
LSRSREPAWRRARRDLIPRLARCAGSLLSTEEAVRQEGGNQVVVLDDLGEVGAFGIAIEV